MLEWSVLIVAGYLAGVLNSIAGGGSFLTFPALVWAGVPPITANATSAVAVLPGYLGGAVGFRKELRSLSMREHVQMSVVGLAGGLAGALLLLVTPAELFSKVVPLLLLLATLMFAFGQKLLALVRNSETPCRCCQACLWWQSTGAISMAGWESCCWRCLQPPAWQICC